MSIGRSYLIVINSRALLMRSSRSRSADATERETIMINESRPVTRSTSASSRDGRCRMAWWTLALALILGGSLRLTWIEDMALLYE